VGDRAINDLGPGAGVVRVVNAGPVSATLEATADGPIQHRTSVTLARGGRRVEIANEITANFADVQTWAFSFNLRAPDVMHEEIGAINRARLAADGGAYAERLSRLDWLTLNHFAAMSGAGGGGITLSNADCAFMKLGRSEVRDGVSHLDTVTPQISVLAGGQVDGPELGIPKQGGDSYFLQRFALEAYDHFDAAASMRSALRHQNPLVAGVVTGGGSYPATSYSLVSISDPNVLLWALKPAEEGIGHGIIARVWNLSAKDTEVQLALDGGIKRARAVSHIETDTGDASVPAGKLVSPISSWQLRSWRLERGSSGKN
jgi:alpha-mannosidase